MNTWYLDLKDKPRVIDFLVFAAPYASQKDAELAEEWVKKYQLGEHVATDGLAEVAKKLALASWPARDAVKTYLSKDGAEEEWEKLLAMTSSSTALLLKRLRQNTGLTTLDEVLAHDDASTALREDERKEVEHLRVQIAEATWKEHGDDLKEKLKTSETALKEYRERFDALRELALSLSGSMQDELFSKLQHYEDRILFAGERVALEVLDEEIKYYREQKEIAPADI